MRSILACLAIVLIVSVPSNVVRSARLVAHCDWNPQSEGLVDYSMMRC